MATDKEIIELMKTGNFTIAYHDSGVCGLYEGKFEYDELPEKAFHEFDCEFDGYESRELQLLVKALGGLSQSI